MSEIRYLLDENVNPRFHKALRRLSHAMTIRAIGEAGTPPLRTPDPIILNWCEEHDFVLVTNNRASMPVHLTDHLAADHHAPGILILNADLSFGDNADELYLIWQIGEAEDIRDQIRFLPISRDH
jgi:predicted nuclease of predicted toxin-antitoxin system